MSRIENVFSTLSEGVINLTVQYFLIYTALFVVKTVNNLRETKMTGLQTMLETACTTATRL